MMQTTHFLKPFFAITVFSLLLAGCASTPAPVVNHSFGGSSPQPAAEPPPPSQPAASNKGVQTFGLGGHVNGIVGAAGYTVAPGDTLYSIAFAHGVDVRQLAALNGIPSPYTIHPGQVLRLKASSASPVPMAGAAAPGTTVVTTNAMTSAQSPARVEPAPTQPSEPVFGPVTTQTMTGNGVAPAASASTTMPAAATVAPTSTAPPPPAQAQQVPVVATPTPPPGATRSAGGITWQWPASGKIVGGFQSGSGGDGAGVDIAGNVGDPVRAAAAGTVVYSGNGLIGYGELIIIKHNDTYLSAYGHNSKRLVKEGDRVNAGQEIALMGASGAPRVELHFEIRKDGKPVDPLGYLPGR
ncbi:MAG TPA: peptidoglycan DD-metalloendopeptidase family protein [Rhodanobacteraceae bacterium]|nr:peptidoglycan DD-metalloendopeptidase family protein [Rhodanobacteraceae bacterium]